MYATPTSQPKKPAVKAAPEKPKKKVVPAKVRLDSSSVTVHRLDQQVLDSLAADEDFKYYTKDYKKEETLWDKFWRWFWDMVGKLFPNVSAGSASIIKYILIGVAVICAVFLIIKLASSDLSNIFLRTPKEAALPYSESLENIHEISFDEEIEAALAARNFKLAVRLLYLASLKQLSDAGLIHWELGKTNSAYLEELGDTDRRQTFGVLTRQFEYIWYGNFPVDATSFNNIQTLFADFKKLLA
ncbi:DUF4129 domain-containing protein [Mucilaginibacter myungsuensis]